MNWRAACSILSYTFVDPSMFIIASLVSWQRRAVATTMSIHVMYAVKIYRERNSESRSPHACVHFVVIRYLL